MAKKFYAVKKGLTPGVYTSWAECEANVKGFAGAIFKGFNTEAEALAFINDGDVFTPPYTINNAINVTPEKESAACNELGDFSEMPAVFAFTDGSYNPDTKVYGFGAILRNGADVHTFQGGGKEPEVAVSRNVAGELMGSMKVISEAIKLNLKEIVIYYDYEGIAKWANKEWKTNKKLTQEYSRFIDDARNHIKIDFVHVKAHTGIPGNELVDKLAKEAVGI